MLVHEAQSAIEANALLSDALTRGEHYDISLIDVSTGSQGGPFWQELVSIEDRATGALALLAPVGQKPALDDKTQPHIHAVLTKPIREQQLYECLGRLKRPESTPAPTAS